MILGQDQAMMFPTMDLYDSGMMKLYADALQKEYERGLTEQKEFMAKYGDFTSPIARDVEAWNQSTMEPISQMVDDMLAHGIDPTRSPEARAILSRRMSTIPYAKLAEMKQSAENAKVYLKTRAEMQAKGLWNPDFENFILGGKTLENWDTSKNGMWTRLAPESYQDLNSATKGWYDAMKPGYLYTKDGYDWIGNSEDDVRSVARQHLPDLTSNYWRYQKELARRQVGTDDFGESAQRQFENNLVAAAAEKYMRPTRVESDDRKRAQDYYYADKLDESKTNRDRYNEALKAADLNFNGVLDDDELSYYKKLKQNELQTALNANNPTNSSSDIPAEGPAQELANQQILNEQNIQRDFEATYEQEKRNAYKKQVSLYGQLDEEDKAAANHYGKLWRRVYIDLPKQGKQDDAAMNKLSAYNKKKSPKFKKWRDQFLYRMENYSAEGKKQWIDKNTTQGLANYQEQPESKLRERSYEIFQRINQVSDLNESQKAQLDKQLGVNGGKNGMMTPNKSFQDITVAELTGNRKYKYNSVPNKVNRIIKGKTYSVMGQDIPSRAYGAGTISGKQYNVINDIALFTDPDVVSELDKIPEEDLKKFGINKHELKDANGNPVLNEDGTNRHGYRIPISTKLGHSVGRAQTNVEGIKNIQGASSAAKAQATMQAREITANINGQ